jgi:hypothetical protein
VPSPVLEALSADARCAVSTRVRTPARFSPAVSKGARTQRARRYHDTEERVSDSYLDEKLEWGRREKWRKEGGRREKRR